VTKHTEKSTIILHNLAPRQTTSYERKISQIFCKVILNSAVVHLKRSVHFKSLRGPILHIPRQGPSSKKSYLEN